MFSRHFRSRFGPRIDLRLERFRTRSLGGPKPIFSITKHTKRAGRPSTGRVLHLHRGVFLCALSGLNVLTMAVPGGAVDPTWSPSASEMLSKDLLGRLVTPQWYPPKRGVVTYWIFLLTLMAGSSGRLKSCFLILISV